MKTSVETTLLQDHPTPRESLCPEAFFRRPGRVRAGKLARLKGLP